MFAHSVLLLTPLHMLLYVLVDLVTKIQLILKLVRSLVCYIGMLNYFQIMLLLLLCYIVSVFFNRINST